MVYILIYAIIMLNTDLHNPKIKTKMTMSEFVRSATSTVLADVFSTAELNRMYRSIKLAPLRICSPSVDQTKLRHLHLPPGVGPRGGASSSSSGVAAGSVLCARGGGFGWSAVGGFGWAQASGVCEHLLALLPGLLFGVAMVALQWAVRGGETRGWGGVWWGLATR